MVLPNYKVLNSIDYIGNHESVYPTREVFDFERYKKKKKKSSTIFLTTSWLLSTAALVTTIYFCSKAIYNETNVQRALVSALEEVLQSSNVTVDDRFLKKFDKFLFKRKGWLTVSYNIDFIGWIILTCNNSLIWLLSTLMLAKKYVNKVRTSRTV
jgi:hypothetical protein